VADSIPDLVIELLEGATSLLPGESCRLLLNLIVVKVTDAETEGLQGAD
jgi:hypothetical protein